MDGDCERLEGLKNAVAADNISEISEIIKSIERISNHLKGATSYNNGEKFEQENLKNNAKLIYRARRFSDEISEFNGLSASPLFDHLLDMYINKFSGREISVTSACIGAACPPTTALRWISYAEGMGLVERNSDPCDRRRSFLNLTREGNEKTEQMIRSYLI